MTATSALKRRYGPAALVTGASDGIGRACAIALAEAGFDLVLVARRADILNNLAELLAETRRVRVAVIACDLASPDAMSRIVEGSAELKIGLVVAAAGFGSLGHFVESPMAEELAMIDVNCRSVAELVHHFGGQMTASGSGGIVLFSSIAAFQGVPGQANYAATKAWVQVFAEGLRRELKPRGVDVLSVAPGPVETGFAKRAGMVMGKAEKPETVARAALAALGKHGTVRPGFLAKLLESALSPLPRRGRTRIMQKVMAGMIPKSRP